MRHARLTIVEAQSRLALLAYNVSDALDPRMQPPLARQVMVDDYGHEQT